jgi:hypothetical protein
VRHHTIQWIRRDLQILSAFLLIIGTVSAFAQETVRRGPQLDPAVRDAVWGQEVKCVATDLGLDAEKSAKLAAAYKVSRERLQKAIEAVPSGDSDDYRARFESMRKIRDAETESFTKELTAFLDEAQSKKAAEQLAAFSGRGDFSVKTLTDIVKNQDTLQKAIHVLNVQLLKFNKETASAMSSAGGASEDRRERRRKMTEELDAELAKVLSADEMKQWKESTANQTRGRNQ